MARLTLIAWSDNLDTTVFEGADEDDENPVPRLCSREVHPSGILILDMVFGTATAGNQVDDAVSSARRVN